MTRLLAATLLLTACSAAPPAQRVKAAVQGEAKPAPAPPRPSCGFYWVADTDLRDLRGVCMPRRRGLLWTESLSRPRCWAPYMPHGQWALCLTPEREVLSA